MPNKHPHIPDYLCARGILSFFCVENIQGDSETDSSYHKFEPFCDLGVLSFLSRSPGAEAGWGGWRPWLDFNFPTHSHIRPKYSVLNNRRKVISEKALSFLRTVPVLPDHGCYNPSVNDCDPWLTQEFSKRFHKFFSRLFLWGNS